MKKNKNVLLKIFNFVFTLISILLLIVGFILDSLNLMLLSIVVLIFRNIIFSLFDINKDIGFIVFNITFFTLLIGGNFFKMISGDDLFHKFSFKIQENTLIILYVNLFFVTVGKYFYNMIDKYKEKKTKKKDIALKKRFIITSEETKYVQNISKILFYITIIFNFLILGEKAIFVLRNSYVALYSSFESIFPTFFLYIANINFLFFLIYLCTFPKKKDLFLIFIPYSICLILSLLAGGRSDLVLNIIIIFIYLIYRQFYCDEKYITKKNIVILVCLSILGISFLGAYNLIRNRVSISNFNPLVHVKQFFVDQGGSSNLISYVQVYKNDLPSTNENYTFGPLITYFKHGTIARIVFGNPPYYRYNTVEMALYGNNLGASLSYLVLKDNYLKGHGLGTQYTAELYTDFGFMGIIIYNFLLGYFIMRLTNVNRNNWISLSMSLYILIQIFYLPRTSAMGWIVNLFSIPNIVSILFIYYLSKLMVERRKKHEITMDC